MRNCFEWLSSSLTDTYHDEDTPIRQWRYIMQQYLHELNVWLKFVSDVLTLDVPSSVSFNETNPEKLWDEVQSFVSRMSNLLYEHIGNTNNVMAFNSTCLCENKQVGQWVLATALSEEATDDLEKTFGGQCDVLHATHSNL